MLNLQYEEFIKKFELTNPIQISGEGLINNRLFSTLETELNKPFQSLPNLAKVTVVYCISGELGGILWESQLWNLSNGQRMLDPNFLLPEVLNSSFDSEYQLSYYDSMVNNSPDFKFKSPRAVVVFFNDGQKLHEFFYHETLFNENNIRALLDKINSLL